MPDTLTLQRSLAALVLDPEPPGEEAFGGCRQGLLAYRELVRLSLVDPLEATFPVTMALLEEEGAWEGCVEAFLEARCVASQHHRDIAPAFLGWLAQTRWGLDLWPFLLELAHFELLEDLVYRFEDAPAQPLDACPGPASRVVLEPSTQVVSYAHAVHRATEEAPRPEAAPTHLLAYRDADGLFQLMELTPATALLLVEAGARPLAEVLPALGITDAEGTFALLEGLRKAGALAGFRGILSPA